MMKKRLVLIYCLVLGNAFSQEEPTPNEPALPSGSYALPVIPDPKVEDSTFIADFPDIEATFVGGGAEIKKFIEKNIQYPQEARENGDQGRVYVTFVVERDGSITNIGLLRKGYVTESLEKEAIRLMSIMPNWVPGEVNGKPVRSRCRLPISFTIDDSLDEKPNAKREK